MLKTETREAMLVAGVRLFSTRSDELLKALSAQDVADEAGFHRQTFYRYWDTHREYLQDLIRWVFTVPERPVVDGVAAIVEVGPDADGGLGTFAAHLAHHDLAAMLDDPIVRMQIGLVVMRALQGSAEQDLVRTYYDETLALLATAYGDLLTRMGREVVPGVTTRDLARMLQAQTLGSYLLMHVTVDDPPAPVLLQHCLRALLETFTRPVR